MMPVLLGTSYPWWYSYLVLALQFVPFYPAATVTIWLCFTSRHASGKTTLGLVATALVLWLAGAAIYLAWWRSFMH